MKDEKTYLEEIYQKAKTPTPQVLRLAAGASAVKKPGKTLRRGIVACAACCVVALTALFLPGSLSSDGIAPANLRAATPLSQADTVVLLRGEQGGEIRSEIFKGSTTGMTLPAVAEGEEVLLLVVEGQWEADTDVYVYNGTAYANKMGNHVTKEDLIHFRKE